VIGKSHQTGYTLIELMIIVAVIVLLAAVALPLYGSYTGTAQAAKLLHHYDQAVRESQQLLMHDRTRVSFDRPSALPATSAAWIDTLAGEQSTAPGGGPAFIAGDTGDPEHGAIGVVFDTADTSVFLIRPAYHGLAAVRALVNVDGVTFSTP
jgi:type II secretory pathway pseudopilin PulG